MSGFCKREKSGAGAYRFGFNGKENDNEVKGFANQQDYGMRIYDPRLGRFLSVDPITKEYPSLTPYQFASNSPISGVDLDGLEYSMITDWLADKAKAAGYPRLSGFVRSLGGGDLNRQTRQIIDNTVKGNFSAAGRQVYGLTPIGMVHGVVTTAGKAWDGDKEAQGELFGIGVTAFLGAKAASVRGGYRPGRGPSVVEEPTRIIEEQATRSSGTSEAAQANTAAQTGTAPLPELIVDIYKDAQATNRGQGMNADHIPSFASLKLAREQALGRELTRQESNALRDNALTLTIESQLHRSLSETYGGRNNRARQLADAANPIQAIIDNVNAYRSVLIERGYTDADINRVIQQLSRPFQNNTTGAGSTTTTTNTTTGN